MAPKYVPPGLKESFNCPHCGALSHQTWFNVLISGSNKNATPLQIVKDDYVEIVNSNKTESYEQKKESINFLERIYSGRMFVGDNSENSYGRVLHNLAIARCYSCNEYSIWTSGRMIYPDYENEIQPSPDLPDEIKLDFLEAAKILNTSPRGSAALLRLGIQKLCGHLGEKGKNINEDIASLVKKGLDARIQKALDVVRVIGNEAVHPGQIDLRDDTETASKLFRLVNMITDAMITQPKSVDDLFESLPESKRREIAKRDA